MAMSENKAPPIFFLENSDGEPSSVLFGPTGEGKSFAVQEFARQNNISYEEALKYVKTTNYGKWEAPSKAE